MKYFYLTLSLLVGTIAYSQQLHRCITPQAIAYQNNLTPGYLDAVNQTFEEAKSFEQKSNHIYTIPVVVHVVYNTPEQNVPDSVIIDQIRVLNEDYNRLNPDTVNMRSDFDIVAGNPRIKFKLAEIDENGLPTTGITRTSTATTSFGSFALIGGDFSDLEKIKSTADGGHDPWDQSRYLNIWVGNMSVDVFGQEVTAILGYATPPPGLPNWPGGSVTGLSDGVVIQYQAMGSNNPVVLDAGGGPIDFRGRTCTHEVGHYLGLRHIWGDGDCTEEDGVDDTPNADSESQQDCDPSKNTCTDNIFGVDLPDMIENYMDYSEESCQNSYTDGQVQLMHGVLEGPRYDLVYGNPASINENEFISWNVMPNPSQGEVIVRSENNMVQVDVFDAQGIHVLRTEPMNSEITLDLSQNASGVYIISITDGIHYSHKRIVLQ